MMLSKTTILDVQITNATSEEILEYLLLGLKKPTKKYYIVTPNPEILVYASKNSRFKKILNEAELALCDGIGIYIAGKLLAKPFKERVTGTDFMEKFCASVAEKPITVGFLGGGSGVAEKTAECLKRKYPELSIVYISQEWEEEGFNLEIFNSKFKIQNSKLQVKNQNFANKLYTRPHRLDAHIDVLFIAFGFPKQEEWIAQNIEKIPVKVAMSVGGAFDYISGKVPRAPLLVRSIGLEWFFRLLVQPWRWKRQLALFSFLWLIIKEKINKKKVEINK